MSIAEKPKLYEGKAKIVYATEDPQVLLTYFKDDATAFNAQKRGQIQGKGEMNCTIASHLFQYLEANGIPTHWLGQTGAREMRVRAVQIIPLEVVVRNRAAGSLCQQTGLPLGLVLPFPLVEFYYKNDALGDPLLTLDRLRIMNLATEKQVETLRQLALQINDLLIRFFADCQITLVDFKLEFGTTTDRPTSEGTAEGTADGTILLADEISPDTCRLWDQTQSDPQARVLDKDRFRQDLGQVEAGYQRVLERVLQQRSA